MKTHPMDRNLPGKTAVIAHFTRTDSSYRKHLIKIPACSTLMLEQGARNVLIRELVPQALIQDTIVHAQNHGYAAQALPLFLECSADGEHLSPAANKIKSFSPVVVARNEATARQTAELFMRLAGAPKDKAGHRNAHRKLGALLGYPACCTESFVQNFEGFAGNTDLFVRSLKSTRKPCRFLLSPYLGLIDHIPCSYACDASIRMARFALKQIAGRGAAGTAFHDFTDAMKSCVSLVWRWHIHIGFEVTARVRGTLFYSSFFTTIHSMPEIPGEMNGVIRKLRKTNAMRQDASGSIAFLDASGEAVWKLDPKDYFNTTPFLISWGRRNSTSRFPGTPAGPAHTRAMRADSLQAMGKSMAEILRRGPAFPHGCSPTGSLRSRNSIDIRFRDTVANEDFMVHISLRDQDRTAYRQTRDHDICVSSLTSQNPAARQRRTADVIFHLVSELEKL